MGSRTESRSRGVSRDDVIMAGLRSLDAQPSVGGAAGTASEAYQDLCQGLNVDQIKQVNTLIEAIQAGRP